MMILLILCTDSYHRCRPPWGISSYVARTTTTTRKCLKEKRLGPSSTLLLDVATNCCLLILFLIDKQIETEMMLLVEWRVSRSTNKIWLSAMG
jgi:hypothetical protein